MIIGRDTLKAALLASSDDTTRFGLNHVRVQPDGTVESTNGHVAFKIKERYQTPDTDFPIVNGRALETLTKPAYISRSFGEKLIKATAKKSSIPVLASIQVGIAPNGDGLPATFAQATDLDAPLAVKLPANEDVRYPDIDRAWPEEGASHIRLILSAEVLSILAKVADTVATTKKGLHSVVIQVPVAEGKRSKPTDDEKEGGSLGDITTALRVRINTSDVTIDGVVMPCRA